MKRDPVGPGQRSVWDYPRPPALEACESLIEVVFDGVRLVETRRALRVFETSHPPVYYLPEADFRSGVLHRTPRTSFCEWKGHAHYFDIVHGVRRVPAVAWGYDEPSPRFAALAGHVALYAGPMDGCFVDGERVVAQPGGFYGGWITHDVVGPFKGGPGTSGW